ncbi:hypothetical protein COO60DRAFT_1518056, partial [Scenedesmus sp. NREL 46B-D3]
MGPSSPHPLVGVVSCVHAWLGGCCLGHTLMLLCALLLGLGATAASTRDVHLVVHLHGDVLLCGPSHTSWPGRASKEHASCHQRSTPSQLLPPTPPPPWLEACVGIVSRAACRSCQAHMRIRQAQAGITAGIDSWHTRQLAAGGRGGVHVLTWSELAWRLIGCHQTVGMQRQHLCRCVGSLSDIALVWSSAFYAGTGLSLVRPKSHMAAAFCALALQLVGLECAIHLQRCRQGHATGLQALPLMSTAAH